ncbi:MAG: DUF3082 domain-containing protein [Prochlorococcaceae cyanobacterium]|jgi:hypothetical protein
MSETPPESRVEADSDRPGPLRCFAGSLTSAGFAGLALLITSRMIRYYGAHPPAYHQPIAQSIAVAVKTLLVGSACLACFTFLLIATGLLLLGVRRLWPASPPPAA